MYVCMYVCMYGMYLEEGHKECHERAASSKVAGFEAEARIQSSDPPCRIDLTTNLQTHNNLYTFIHQYTHTYIHTYTRSNTLYPPEALPVQVQKTRHWSKNVSGL